MIYGIAIDLASISGRVQSPSLLRIVEVERLMNYFLALTDAFGKSLVISSIKY